MRKYVLRSFVRAFLIMFIVVTIVFVILRIGPLDPAQTIAGDYANQELLKRIRGELGLDQAIYIQYFTFLRDLGSLEFGYSYMSSESTLSLLLDVLPYTIELIIAGTLIGILIGVPLGILAALRPNGVLDQIIRGVTLVGISIPGFVMGLFLMSLLSLKLDLLPAIGVGNAGVGSIRLTYLILPAFSCGIMMIASVTRLTRASLIDTLKKDYLLTARAKGVRESIVILKHALRNSLIPLITFIGIQINVLLGAAVLIELIFSRPGVGRLIVDGIKTCDFPVVQITIMFYAGSVVIINLIADISCCIVDPRIVYK